LQENNSVQYTDSNLGIPDENTESNTIQNSDLGMLKLSASYKPNVNNQLDYDIIGRISKETQDQRYFSSVIGDINQFEETSPYSINQNLNYYYTLNDSNIFALEVQHLIKNEDPFYEAFLQDKDNYENTAIGIGLDNNQLGYDIAQDKRVKSNQLDAKLDYWNFSGGFRMPSRQSGTNINLGSNDIGFLTMQNNRAKSVETKFGAAKEFLHLLQGCRLTHIAQKTLNTGIHMKTISLNYFLILI